MGINRPDTDNSYLVSSHLKRMGKENNCILLTSTARSVWGVMVVVERASECGAPEPGHAASRV